MKGTGAVGYINCNFQRITRGNMLRKFDTLKLYKCVPVVIGAKFY